MSRQASPTLIGAFVFGALTLAVVAVLLLAGGTFLQERRRHVIYFEGAAQGLQVGAPVMFLGVKVGRVTRIQLGLDEQQRFLVPVTVEIEPNTVRSRGGESIDLREQTTMRRLVDRGLRARLRMQSLLTGQLYVDLDFHPDKVAQFVSHTPAESEIPAIPTPVQEIASRLENFQADLFLADLAAITTSIKTLLADPAATEIPGRLATTLGHLESMARRLDSELPPSLDELRSNLNELRQTLHSIQAAMGRVTAAADRVGALADPEGKLVARWTKAAEELQGTAKTLAALGDEESPSLVGFNTALREMTKAARALRTLAESLEQRPEALLRGKPDTENTP
ncbi:MAG: hypothetical protein BWK76_21195 [Desulfobulbaceae bacterium A2]|nr:MAG: hypothetical protein BWK76_21195 [Desulfobulbaceae bacterium A2]